LEKDFGPDETGAKEVMKGYFDHYFGALLYYYFIFLTLSWFPIFIWIDYEVYSGKAFFAGSGRALDLQLIFTWHIVAIWFPFAKFMSPNLRNFYRARVPLSAATSVAVWQQADDQILLEDDSRATRLVRWGTGKIKEMFGVPGYTTTLAVRISSAGTRYFDYHCARRRIQISISTLCGALHSLC
jgi:hypothetical protein